MRVPGDRGVDEATAEAEEEEEDETSELCFLSCCVIVL